MWPSSQDSDVSISLVADMDETDFKSGDLIL